MLLPDVNVLLNAYFVEQAPHSRRTLFLFPAPTTLGFWMENTYVPLDIAFLDDLGRVMQIIHGKPLDTTVLRLHLGARSGRRLVRPPRAGGRRHGARPRGPAEGAVGGRCVEHCKPITAWC